VPELISHRIVNYADNDFTLFSQGDGNAEVRDAIEVIDGPINRIDDPLKIGGMVFSASPSSPDDGVVWETSPEAIRDQRLRANIKLQLDIVSFFDVHFERSAEVFANQGAGLREPL